MEEEKWRWKYGVDLFTSGKGKSVGVAAKGGKCELGRGGKSQHTETAGALRQALFQLVV